jgi:hypothetical protein
MKAVIDGDVFAYQAACVAEKDPKKQVIDFGEAVVPRGDRADPRLVLLNSLSWVKRMPKISGIIIALSSMPKISGIIIALSSEDGSNFRKEIHPGYKRDRSEKPEAFQDMIDIMVRDYKCYRFPRLEGDDVMGLLMTGTQGHNYVGITSDKDIYTLPGKAIRLNHDKTPRKSSVLQADKFWMTQTITGDPVRCTRGWH